jgi:type II secretory ATPase GspE/PulE/Tfp pilus assembly ATPase PilB-like protein/ActR/RegA family two-component response regulator
VARAIDRAYPPGADVRALVERLGRAAGEVAGSVTPAAADAGVAARCILGAALAAGASEIQIEPGARGAIVRHRVCGILEPLVSLPTSAVAGVTNAIKLQGQTDIACRHRPQTGAFRVRFDGRSADVRLSVLPTIHGETLLLRVIDGESPLPRLDTLGSPDDARQPLVEALSRPDGLVLVAGPAGTGKTTTLYAAVAHLHDAGRPVVTVEDPIERHLDGVSQVAVNPRAGATWAAALRSVMRQDGRAIMLADMRDGEVAELAGRAAADGRLVLGAVSTLDAASAVIRLVNLGLSPTSVADSLNAVVAGRLLRMLCPDCRVVHDASAARRAGAAFGLAAIGASPGEGCERCRFTGYLGRVAVLEALVASDDVRCLIRNGAGAADLRGAMARAGWPSLLAGALRLVERGVTSMDELNRVLREHGDVARASARLSQTPTILVVDDDRLVRVLARRLLESSGYRVIEADSGVAGLAAARRERPDMVVLDGRLPDLPWPRTIEILHRDVFLSTVPVMVLTPEGETGPAAEALDHAADDYLSRPFAPELLIARVGAVLRRARRYAS